MTKMNIIPGAKSTPSMDSSRYTLPLVAVRNLVVYPKTLTPLYIGRQPSLDAVYGSMTESNFVVIVAQKENSEEIDLENLYNIGVSASILHISKVNNNSARVLVDSSVRVKILNITKNQTSENKFYYLAEVEEIPYEPIEKNSQWTALRSSIIKATEEYGELTEKNDDLITSLKDINTIDQFAFSFMSLISADIAQKQEILEVESLYDSLQKAYELLVYKIESIKSEHEIQEKVRKKISKNQKEYYLNEQMKTIQDELHKVNPDTDKSDYGVYKAKLNKSKLPKYIKDKCMEELEKIKGNSHGTDSAICRTYIDFCLALPWSKKSAPNKDLAKARGILDENHFGLEKIKERVIEYIAVYNKSTKYKGNVLCLHGPPGVGKTSLVKSIAKAMGREYVKISLGGLRDESEIRGHRKTYVGAFAGKILGAMKKAKVVNPVILLDEIDKVGMSHRGDPYSALLEVLDPEQNKEFNDHYLEESYDLSNVIFIATANSLDMPRPLLDRFDLVSLSGYTESEKVAIFKQYLLQEVSDEHGLKPEEIDIDEECILNMIHFYAKESGVRELRRQLAKISRKAVVKLESDKDIKSVEIKPDNLKDFLGIKKYKFNQNDKTLPIGTVTGLAYNEVGGDTLTIEIVRSPEGEGKIKMTGKLGDVMKESVDTAYSYIMSYGEEYGIDVASMKKYNIHMHVPEGAVPKDGPSAGLAITNAIVSLFVQKAFPADIAMTGEVTLHGKALPIGGLKEKLMSAVRSQIKTVFIPDDNVKDLEDIPNDIKESLEIIPVNNVKQIIERVLM